jgi:hypothetical protein
MFKIELKINMIVNKINYMYNIYFIDSPYIKSDFYLINLK